MERVNALNSNDVLFGKGLGASGYIGTQRFRDICETKRSAYQSAKKADKTVIAQEVVDIVRRKGGRFLKQDESNGPVEDIIFFGIWYEVNDEREILEKAKQNLRQKNIRKKRVCPSNPYEEAPPVHMLGRPNIAASASAPPPSKDFGSPARTTSPTLTSRPLDDGLQLLHQASLLVSNLNESQGTTTQQHLPLPPPLQQQRSSDQLSHPAVAVSVSPHANVASFLAQMQLQQQQQQQQQLIQYMLLWQHITTVQQQHPLVSRSTTCRSAEPKREHGDNDTELKVEDLILRDETDSKSPP
jgi:hypothetical protein